MSRSSVPFSMPSCHIQLKSTALRSLAPAAGVYGAPAFGSAPRPRPCPAAGACCAPAVDATPIATSTLIAVLVQRFLRPEFMQVLRPSTIGSYVQVSMPLWNLGGQGRILTCWPRNLGVALVL